MFSAIELISGLREEHPGHMKSRCYNFAIAGQQDTLAFDFTPASDITFQFVDTSHEHMESRNATLSRIVHGETSLLRRAHGKKFYIS